MGDLTLAAGKSSVQDDTVYSVGYTATMDALTVTASMDQASDYVIALGYALGDSLTISSVIDSLEANTSMGVSYTSGNMTASVTKTDDTAGSTDASVALDFGNADLKLARDGGEGDGETSVTYTVAF